MEIFAELPRYERQNSSPFDLYFSIFGRKFLQETFVILVYQENMCLRFLDPLRVLCNSLSLFVRPSVRLSVTKVLILPAISFFLIFCIKLALYKRFKVTKPDFRKKMSWPKFGPKLGPK